MSDAGASARAWLRFAGDDLRTAEQMLREGETFPPRHACFHAQQAAEKAIKAVLIGEQVNFTKTHDLEVLAELVPDERRLRDERPDLPPLTQWAVESRYPNGDDPSPDDAAEAVRLARRIVEPAEQDFDDRESE